MILLRHGVPAAAETCYGRFDPPLAEPPEQTAARLRTRLPRWRRLVSSPSPRCRLLAEALAPNSAIDLADALMELNFGQWEGQPWSRIPRTALDDWARRPLDFTPPGGESARELKHRVERWVDGFRPAPGDLIVAHAGSLRALAATLLDTEFERTWQWPLPFATPVRITDTETGFVPLAC